MRLQTVIGVALCGALGLACGGGPGVVAPPDNHQAPFADLGQRKAVLSGVVYDPEAFFYSLAMFPQDPEHPEQTPPPALLSGIPYLLQSALPNTRVAVMDGTTQAVASPPSTPTGDWQAIGVPGHDEARFELFATPPTGELNLGADFFPSPPFAAVPTARYFPTRTLKTVLPARTYCFDQVATAVGSAGALEALANFETMIGNPTTVDDLRDPAKTGGVLLLWAYSPSFVLDLFTIPSDPNVRLFTNNGTAYAIEWAPPGVLPPGFQSAMGYFVGGPASETGSSLGYYAIVLPPGASPQVSVTVTDTLESEDPTDGRPWVFPELNATVRPGVSFRRHFAQPSPTEGPPPDENAEPFPSPDFTFTCDQ